MAYERSTYPTVRGKDNRFKTSPEYPTEAPRPAPQAQVSPAVRAGIPFVPSPPSDMARYAREGAKIPIPQQAQTPQGVPFTQFEKQMGMIKPQVPQQYPAQFQQMGAGAYPPTMEAPIQAGMVQQGMMPTGQITGASSASGAKMITLTPEEKEWAEGLSETELYEMGLNSSEVKAAKAGNLTTVEGSEKYNTLKGEKEKGKMGKPKETGPTEDEIKSAEHDEDWEALGKKIEAMDEGYDEEWVNSQLEQGYKELDAQFQEAMAQQGMAASLGGYGFTGAAADISGRLTSGLAMAKSKLKVDIMMKQFEAKRQDKWNKLQLMYQYGSDTQKMWVQDQLMVMQKDLQAAQIYSLRMGDSLDRVEQLGRMGGFDITKEEYSAIMDMESEASKWWDENPDATDAELGRFIDALLARIF